MNISVDIVFELNEHVFSESVVRQRITLQLFIEFLGTPHTTIAQMRYSQLSPTRLIENRYLFPMESEVE